MNRDDPTETELARLADGTLPEAQVAALQARIRESPQLQARLRDQERAVALTRASAQVTAPASLYASVRRQAAGRPRRARRNAWRPTVLVPLAAGLAVAVVLVVVALSASSATPNVPRTARLALAGPTRGAPSVDPSDGDLLSLRVGSIAFPAYGRHADWRAIGARTDRLGGRRVQTVFYAVGGRRVGYSIVSGAALPVPRGRWQTIDDVRYVTAPAGSAELVTWRRAGHTCVIAGRGVSRRTLLTLASASAT